MPRRHRNALRYRKPRVRKHTKRLQAPLTPGQFHASKRMPAK